MLPQPSVVYEVLIDRFSRSQDGVTAVQAWGEEDDRHLVHGGDLRGVTRRLDHLVELGVDTLLLSPVWPSTSALGDEIEDFFSVSPALGGEEAFDELLQAAQQRGMWVLLTGLFDRVGHKHDWFVEATTQELDDGRIDPSQRRRSFFSFEQAPFGHAAYRGDQTQPELNLQDYHLRHKLLHGDRSVLRTWIDRGINGWRIDHAESLGYEVLGEILRASRNANPDCLVIGDARAFAAREVRDGLVDGVVNHYLREAVVAFLRGRVPAQELGRVLEQQVLRYGSRGLSRCFNVLSSAGDPRLLSLLDGDARRMHLAVQLQYALPGAAVVFYGDEVGLVGAELASCRRPMEWDRGRWNPDLLQAYKQMGALRRAQRALVSGDVTNLTPSGEPDVFALARSCGNPRDTVVAAFNRSDRAREVTLFVAVGGMVDGLPMRDALSETQAVFRNGVLDLVIPAHGAVILAPALDALAGYRFLKDR
ncbi:MAG: alpha-amylase family glycosyl hydrolase [Pseudomonadota bacterium]